MKHPRDLPPEWFAIWEERAAIIQEGCQFPTGIEGTKQANRLAFEQVLQLIAIDRGEAEWHYDEKGFAHFRAKR